MPIPNTKYNYITKFQTDICNSSFLHNHFIITCDASDTVFTNNEALSSSTIENKIYLTNKAAFLFHPFSKHRNCITIFNNDHPSFKQKNLVNSRRYYNPSLTTCINPEIIQQNIQNQVKVASSLYSMNLATFHVTSGLDDNVKPWHNASDRIKKHGTVTAGSKSSHKPNKGVDIKHNSYDRYLARRKSQHLKQDSQKSTATPNYANKTMKFGIAQCKQSCSP